MRLHLVLLVLAAAGTLTAGGEARAQVRFSIGGSGWSVGNTPYGYGNGWGYGYGGYGRGYYNPPVYRNYYYDDDDDYVPQAVPQPTYRQAYTPAKPYSGPGVTVRNPAGSDVKLVYLLDDQREFEIAAGETQKLMEKRSYVVSFDRGGEHGTARYTISEGVYEFTVTNHGWELYRQKDVSAEKQAEAKVKPNPLPEVPKPQPADPELPKPRDAE